MHIYLRNNPTILPNFIEIRFETMEAGASVFLRRVAQEEEEKDDELMMMSSSF